MSKLSPYTPIAIHLKHSNIFSKFNSKLQKENPIATKNDINTIIKVIKMGVIPSYNTILTFCLMGYKDSVEELLKCENNIGQKIFPLTGKLFSHACMSGNISLIKFLQEKECEEDELDLIHIIGNGYSKETIIWALKNLSFGKIYHLGGGYLSDYTCILVVAIGTGNLDTVKFLMNEGFGNLSKNRNYITYGDLTPLISACELPFKYGERMITYLIEQDFKYNINLLSWTDTDSEEDIVGKWTLLFKLCKFDKNEIEKYRVTHIEWIETVVKKKFDEEWLINVGLINNLNVY